jgi:hypothetical protein
MESKRQPSNAASGGSSPLSFTIADLYPCMYRFSNEVIGRMVYGARLGNLAVAGNTADTQIMTSERAALFGATLLELFVRLW